MKRNPWRASWARFQAWLFEDATLESIREGIAGLCLLALVAMVILDACVNGKG